MPARTWNVASHTVYRTSKLYQGYHIFHAGNVTVEEAVKAYKKEQLEQITQSGTAHGGMNK